MRSLPLFVVLTLALAQTAMGCRKDPPPLPPPPPLDPGPPTADAGPAQAAPAGAAADIATATPTQADVFQPPQPWNKERPSALNPNAVAVGVDVVGAGAGALSPSNPAAWFKDLCGSRYECRLQAVQSPGKTVVTVARQGASQDQVGKAVDKQWLDGTAASRKGKDTNVPAWTAAWLSDAEAGDVAVLWFDGMADNHSANAVVDDDKLADLGGAWVLPGRIVNSRKGEPSALMVYVLARTGKVAEGWKVAHDLANHARSSMSDSRASAYRVEFVADGALELYPGDLWSGKARLTETAPSLKSVAHTASRKALVREASEVEATHKSEFALPAVVRLGPLVGSPKLPMLVSAAEQWDASAKADVGIAGWNLDVEITGDFPAIFPVQALVVDTSWRMEPFPKDTLRWPFADNNNPDFRHTLTVLSACSASGPGGKLRFGLADALPCASGGEAAMTCGAMAAGQLGNNVFGHPAIKKLLSDAWPATGCAMRALSQPVSDQAVAAPIRGPVVLSAVGNLDVPLACFEQTLAESPELSALTGVLAEMSQQCDSKLLSQFRSWLAPEAQLPIGVAFAQESLNLTLPNGGRTSVNKLYAFRLLHKFAQSLGRRSLQDWRTRTKVNNAAPQLELVRVVVESPRSK